MTSNDQKNQINLHLPENYDGKPVEIVIREGQASKVLDEKEPIKVEIIGTISSVYEWLSKRISLIKQKASHIRVSRDEMAIVLYVDETSPYHSFVCGKLELSKEINDFGINTDKRWEPVKLSMFIKMHRSFFTDKSENMRLVSTLKSFKAKVTQDVERVKEESGSKVDCFTQVVDSNIPKAFKVNIPMFKGFPREEIEIETYADIDGRDVSLALVSAGANEIMEEYRNKVIDEQLEKIKAIAPDLAIIEV